jgi:uncharacterized membrane protein
MIQSSTIVLMAHGDTMNLVSGLYDFEETEEPMKDPVENPEWADLLAETPDTVKARNSGYVERMNFEEILNSVVDSETKVVEIPPGPGTFVSAGLPVVKVWPAREGGLEPTAERQANKSFVFGKERTFQQDLAFGIRQLSDIALKGLSPGINDPTTTMQAMDRIEAILIGLGTKSLPNKVQWREVDGNEVLVKIGYPDFDTLAGLAFDQVRRAAFTSGQVAVLEQLLVILERAMQTNTSDERQQALWDRVYAIARQTPREIPDSHDAANLVMRAVNVLRSATMKQRVRSDRDLDELSELSDDLPDDGKIQETVALLRKRLG